MQDNIEPGNESNPDNSSMTHEQENKSSQSSWKGFSDEDSKYVGDKGWKTPDDVLKSYKELEKQASTKISIPKDEDADAWNKLYAKLGKPETADKYDISVNDKDKADIQKLFFETNQTPKQAQALVAGFERLQQEKQKEYDAMIDAENKKQEESVIAEWGDDADKNTELMNRGAKLLGLDDDDLAAIKMTIAPRKYMEALKKLGEAISEDNLPVGDQKGKSEEMSTVDFYKQYFKD